MAGFLDACELASCHFGLHGATSCIGRAWETRRTWIFEPAEVCHEERRGWLPRAAASPQAMRSRISIDKESGWVQPAGGWIPDGALEVTAAVPGKYLMGWSGESKAHHMDFHHPQAGSR